MNSEICDSDCDHCQEAISAAFASRLDSALVLMIDAMRRTFCSSTVAMAEYCLGTLLERFGDLDIAAFHMDMALVYTPIDEGPLCPVITRIAYRES